jgi:phosphocarrier protein HPr
LSSDFVVERIAATIANCNRAAAPGNKAARSADQPWHRRSNASQRGDSVQVREVTIVNRLGLHARAAVKLVSLCSKYVSSIVLVVNGRRAGGRQLIAILLLSASMGAQVSVQAQGPDEVEAVAAVTRLISNGFGEG